MCNKKEILEYIDIRLDSMTSEGAMRRWGKEEALELQVLQLLEFRSLVFRPKAFKENPQEIRRMYSIFKLEYLADDSAIPIWANLKKHKELDDLPETLADFVNFVKNELPLEK